MRILVTGGSGFVGSHVVQTLLTAGHEVRVLDLAARQAPLGSVALVGDVRDPATCAAAVHGVDVVCHHAAKVGSGGDVQDLPAYVSSNDLGTAVLLAAMAEASVRRLVLASSMVVYGEGAYSCAEHGRRSAAARSAHDLAAGRFEPPCPVCGEPLRPEPVAEDAALDPRSAYAATKVAQEHLAASWARACSGTAVALRYHNVYGPRMPRDTLYAGVASVFASALVRGEPPMVFEDGGQRRDFVHVHDVAAANVAAMSIAPHLLPAGTVRAYNVASGVPRTVGELAGALAAALHGPEPVVTGQFRLGDIRHVTASARRLRDELGWASQVCFADGVAQLATSAETLAEASGALA